MACSNFLTGLYSHAINNYYDHATCPQFVKNYKLRYPYKINKYYIILYTGIYYIIIIIENRKLFRVYDIRQKLQALAFRFL